MKIVAFCALALGFSPALVHAVPFTSGDIVVDRIAGTTSAASAVFVDEYTPSGTLVQSIPMPTAVSGSNLRLTDSGSATSDGYLNLSADGLYITVPGYDANTGTAGVASSSTTSGTPVVRVVGRVDSAGNVDTSTSTALQNTNNMRSAVAANGTDIWSSGGANGAVYSAFGTNTGTQVSTTITNGRNVEIYNNQLFVSSGSGSFKGISSYSTALPAGTGNTATLLIPSNSPYGFFMADLNPSVPGLDTAYVADDGVGIEKFSLVGSTWTANGVVGVAADQYRGLTGAVTANGVQLYATRQGTTSPGIYGMIDTAGYNTAISATPNLIAALPTGSVFRGIDYAPVPEPGTFVLTGIGLGLVAIRRLSSRRRNRLN